MKALGEEHDALAQEPFALARQLEAVGEARRAYEMTHQAFLRIPAAIRARAPQAFAPKPMNARGGSA